MDVTYVLLEVIVKTHQYLYQKDLRLFHVCCAGERYLHVVLSLEAVVILCCDM